MRFRYSLFFAASSLAAAACSESSPGTPPDNAPDSSQNTTDAQPDVLADAGSDADSKPDPWKNDGSYVDLVAKRPYVLKVPSAYAADAGVSTDDAGRVVSPPLPLVILLHGYSANSDVESIYFGTLPVAEERKWLVALPEGTPDSQGKQFWNATDACCDVDGMGIDDVAYLNAIMDDVASKYNLDKKRVFLTGHSNGGFMSYRMACESSGRVAAIWSLAGAMWLDTSKCKPTENVSIAEIHGDADESVNYDGGISTDLKKEYPSAHVTVQDWATLDKCTGSLKAGDPADLVPSTDGAETKVERYEGCPAGTSVELWTVQGGPHSPFFDATKFSNATFDFFAAHPKP